MNVLDQRLYGVNVSRDHSRTSGGHPPTRICIRRIGYYFPQQHIKTDTKTEKRGPNADKPRARTKTTNERLLILQNYITFLFPITPPQLLGYTTTRFFVRKKSSPNR